MGSKQALSNGNEPEELTDLVNGFELHNQVRIALSADLRLHGGSLDLQVRAVAMEGRSANGEAAGSVLASAQCWGHEFKLLMGLYTTLLYRLDFALAEREMLEGDIPRA